MIEQPSLAQPDGMKTTAAGFTIDKAVLTGIRNASRATGVDFGYLMAQAAQESGFRASAAAAASSAKGLYQFVDSTWLQMMRDHGAKYGYGALARQITTEANGAPMVADQATRQRILDLRNDPALAASLGAEYARGNKLLLEQGLGRTATSTDLYMAHFLGPSGAADFLKALGKDQGTPAAQLFPRAAAANPKVFYTAEGKARSLGDIYSGFARSIESRASAFAALGTGDAIVAARTADKSAVALASIGSLGTVAAFHGSSGHAFNLSSLAAIAVYEALGRLKLPEEQRNAQETARG